MKNKILSLQDPICLVFLTTFLYWIYLVFTSRMTIAFDAIDYESLGKMLAEKGWIEFFRTGPHREPFYPALIAVCMRLGNFFGLSYQLIQVLIQFLILFLTQIMTLYILRILKINNLICALTILYMGFSPALVNSSLSLYSEIVTYPFILAIMILIYKSWFSFDGPKFRLIFLAIATGFLFVIMTINKGIFELVTPVFLILFLISALFTHQRRIFINILMYLLVFLTVFYPLVIGYKMINKNYNGLYTVTNRGAWALYGNVALRTEPLSTEHFFFILANVPGEGVCRRIFGEQKYRSWSGWNSDRVGAQKMSELSKSNLSSEAACHTLVSLSKQKIFQNPGQYVLLTMIEGSKMFFWESTQVGYVEYSPGLTKFFACTVIKNGLRFVMSFLTIFALVYLVVLLRRQGKEAFKKENPLLFLYLSLLFIFSFISSYSFFCIITRYAFPIVSLYLIIIVFVFQKICEKYVRNSR